MKQTRKIAERRIRPEWVAEEWVTVADADPARQTQLADQLVAAGFPRDRILRAVSGEAAKEFVGKLKSCIVFLDDSLGVSSFNAVHGSLVSEFGPQGFFLFAITGGDEREFVQFSATASIDGIIYRPYRPEEFQGRIIEVFAAKWSNRSVELPGADGETFQRAREKEDRLGRRGPLVPDPKVSALSGLKPVELQGLAPGAASFEKVTVAFRVEKRNGRPLSAPLPLQVLEVDGEGGTFEFTQEKWSVDDELAIVMHFTHGSDSHSTAVTAFVTEVSPEGFLSVKVAEKDQASFKTAMESVATRIQELKDFFKYAKGA